MSAFKVRSATPADVSIIFELIQALADYEKAAESVIASESDITHALFDDIGSTHGLICEKEGDVVGFAVYYLSFSTWQGKHGLYLEDLYVTKHARGKGAGKALFEHLAQLAVTQGLTRFEWSVLNWNRPAIQFYEAFGARPQSEWVRYRLSGAALLACAKRGTPQETGQETLRETPWCGPTL